MKAITTPAQIDVAIPKDNVIDLYEVKMYEFIDSKPAKFEDKYFKEKFYSSLSDKTRKEYIKFISKVVENFGKGYYGEGLKQLSCHILGILNKIDVKLKDYSKINLYSFCYDFYEDEVFIKKLNSYKKDLLSFKNMVDDFLKSIELSNRIEYYGFLSASELKEKVLISPECVMRYFTLKETVCTVK